MLKKLLSRTIVALSLGLCASMLSLYPAPSLAEGSNQAKLTEMFNKLRTANQNTNNSSSSSNHAETASSSSAGSNSASSATEAGPTLGENRYSSYDNLRKFLAASFERQGNFRVIAKRWSKDPEQQKIIANYLINIFSDPVLKEELIDRTAQYVWDNQDTQGKGLTPVIAGVQEANIKLFNEGITRLRDDEVQKLLEPVVNTATRWDDNTCKLIFSGNKDKSTYQVLMDTLQPRDLERFLTTASTAMRYSVEGYPSVRSLSPFDLTNAHTVLLRIIGTWAFTDPDAAKNAISLIKGGFSKEHNLDPVALCHTSTQLLNTCVTTEGEDGELMRRLIVYVYTNYLQ